MTEISTLFSDGQRVMVFKLVPVDDSFSFNNDKRYIEEFHQHMDYTPIWDSGNLSEEFNKQVKKNLLTKFQLDNICKSQPLDLRFFLSDTNVLDFNVEDTNLMQHTCDDFQRNNRSRWDVLSKDHDAFEYINKPKRNNSIDIHVVVALNIDNEYIGHVYVWVSPIDATIATIIGIRSSSLTSFSRLKGGGVSKISSYLLEGVRQFSISNSAEKIYVQSPLDKMVRILEKNGFSRLLKVENKVFGYGGGLTNNISPYCFNCYSIPDLSRSFHQN